MKLVDGTDPRLCFADVAAYEAQNIEAVFSLEHGRPYSVPLSLTDNQRGHFCEHKMSGNFATNIINAVTFQAAETLDFANINHHLKKMAQGGLKALTRAIGIAESVKLTECRPSSIIRFHAWLYRLPSVLSVVGKFKTNSGLLLACTTRLCI